MPVRPDQLSKPSPDDFADIDRHFALFIRRFGGGFPTERAARSLSRAVRQGHICLDLNRQPEGISDNDIPWPSLDQWRQALSLSRAVASSGDNAATPLVLDSAGRLYLRRYYAYEQSLAGALRERAALFPEDVAAEGQEAAIEAACARNLTVISGGPGTGKTTTVVRILARLICAAPNLRVALCAPTGKAAARLEQSVRGGWSQHAPPNSEALLAKVPRAATLHRLLGVRPNSHVFRHHAGSPLPVDVVVLDEASMVPLPLMAKFFDAVPSTARVILLGDRDQLASVDPGSVLADLADAACDTASPLRSALVTLRKNYRFGDESTIRQLCEAVRAGDSNAALTLLRETGHPDLAGAPLPSASSFSEHLRSRVLSPFGQCFTETDPARALDAFNQFRVLCAVRQGPHGVNEINRQIEAILRRANQITGNSRLYAGLPILVNQNDYQIGLLNGDVGIILPDPDPSHGSTTERTLWAWFPAQSAGEPMRRVAPARLPPHEPAFAMTIHKSQGSEFDRVLLILPDRDAPILTRELIYTGLTRARTRVDVWFNAGTLSAAVERKTERTSGLRDALTARTRS